MKRLELAALIDGAALDEEAARALWTEFSAHMDANQGDFAGFAKKKGWASVAPEYRQGKAVLVVRTGAAPSKPTPGNKPKPKPGADGPAKPPRRRR